VTVADQSIGAFLDAVASEQVTPSGGAAAAVSGAMGAALCEMVCIHTTDDTRSRALDDASDRLEEGRHRLLELADEDVTAVRDLQTAFENDVPPAKRADAARRATDVPLSIAETALAVIESAVAVTESGNPNAVPDGVTGAFLAYGALRASLSTVAVNLELLDDEDYVAQADERSTEIATTAETALSRVLQNVDH